ncbi:MAG: DUF4249 domain-containing protein [Bacteroidales bacterium]
MNVIRAIVIIIITGLLASCKEEIELYVEDANQNLLVVDGMITSERGTHQVTLSRTGDFYHDRMTPRVQGAVISIRDGVGNLFPLKEISAGVYQTAPGVYGLPGREYTLEIDFEGERHTASSTMKRPMEIDTLRYRWESPQGPCRILLYAQEPPGRGDYYMWHLYRNGTLMTDALSKVHVMSDELIDGSFLHGYKVDWFGHDFDIQRGDTVTVVQHSITREAFEFIMAVTMDSFSGNDLGLNPPANLPGNVSNSLGLFHASAVSKMDIVIGD